MKKLIAVSILLTGAVLGMVNNNSNYATYDESNNTMTKGSIVYQLESKPLLVSDGQKVYVKVVDSKVVEVLPFK